MSPFQHFDDDDYTPAQRSAMVAVLRQYIGTPTRDEIIRDARLHKELKGMDIEEIKAGKKRLTAEYYKKQKEWMDVANERAMYACELITIKDLAKHGITPAEYWEKKDSEKI